MKMPSLLRAPPSSCCSCGSATFFRIPTVVHAASSSPFAATAEIRRYHQIRCITRSRNHSLLLLLNPSASAFSEASVFWVGKKEERERELGPKEDTFRNSGERGHETSHSRLLPPQLHRESLPKHVAIIMDGNSRWARARGLPVSAGHQAGYRTLREIVHLSTSWGIRALTVFAFSSENWLRPKPEVNFLMTLFEGVLSENLDDFLREGIRLCLIGDSSKLPKSLQSLAKEAQEMTRNNSHLQLIVAISYSGRSDIVQACKKIADKVKNGVVEPADITESVFAEELETNCTGNFSYPDLLIRTSGELRLSNFLLWQSAYTELYFADTLWPDFGEAEYLEALVSFQERQRRYGKRGFTHNRDSNS